MFRSALFGLVSVAALMGAANAADMYRHEGGSLKDTPYVSQHVWKGFYVGVNAGYGWSEDEDIKYDYPPLAPKNVDAGYDLAPEGFFGGGQLGYNLQSGKVVFGVETDFQFSGIDDDKRGNTPTDPLTGCCTEDTTSLSTDVEWFGTLRGRLGYAFDRTLVYITGGFAYGEVEVDNSYFFAFTQGPGPKAGSSDSSEVETGYVIGAGFEHALSSKWSVKAEYQYIDLGSVDVRSPVFTSAGVLDTYVQETEVDVNFHTVRLGLNYKIQRDHQPLK